LKGVSSGHRQVIDSVQPFNHNPNPASEVHGLSSLRDLSNFDKHRLIHAVLFAVDVRPADAFRLTSNDDAGEQMGKPKLQPFAEGEAVEILSIGYSCPGPKPEVTVEGNLPIGVGFGEDRIRLTALPGMAHLVGTIIEQYAADFP
jgi:hypothetical protein